MQKNLYWAYVSFTEVDGGKKRPVLYLRQDDKNYVVFRLTSKYENKFEFIKQKYVEIVNWQQAGLSKPSWVDTVQVYTLPVSTTKLSYVGQLSSADIQRLINNI